MCDQQAEIWRHVTIPEFADTYSVSNKGRVRRDRGSSGSITYAGRILKASINYKGYAVVRLCNSPHARNCKIHRLVALAFLPNPEGKPTVNHKNGDKADNRLENLEWATNRENNEHAATELGRYVYTPQLSDEQVLAVRNSDLSCRQLGQMFGVYPATIRQIKNGLTYKHLSGVTQ